MMDRNQLGKTIERMADFIESSADFGRTDRLWPSHYSVFSTNPLSIAYGACGTAEFLRRARGGLSEDVVSWMLDRSVTPHDYPPGLYVGSAGVAYAFLMFGLEERAEEVMRECCYVSPLLFEDPTFFFGVAGWGAASLAFHRHTGRQLYLDWVNRACDHLIENATEENGGLNWKYSLDDEVHFGFGYGSSGIGLFLLQAGTALGRDDVVRAATGALEHDLANRQENSQGWTWSERVDGSLALPYWGHGASGVGSAAIRFHEALGEPHHGQAARRIAESANCVWTILPSQVEGLSGIADYMLDMHRFTGDPAYFENAATIARTILWYAIDRSDGIAFPGRWLTRISADFASGSAGIGLFLHRLLNPGPRFLIDLIEPASASRGLRVASEDVPRPADAAASC
jgi:lantibiotic modifying enzyme